MDSDADEFDFGRTFGDDYLYFVDDYLTDERADTESALIWQLLELTSSSRILDVPCGFGRIANRLAAFGCQVSGLDDNQHFLDQARNDAVARGVTVDYHCGDMRSLPTEGPFDVVLCWFNSFGYFNDRDNRRVLGEFRRQLEPGGQLLIETLNHDGVVRHFTQSPDATISRRGDDTQIDTNWFDPETGRVRTERTTHREGRTQHSRHFVRLPALTEWKEWLERAGFANPRFMELGGDPVTVDTWRMVVVATAT